MLQLPIFTLLKLEILSLSLFNLQDCIAPVPLNMPRDNSTSFDLILSGYWSSQLLYHQIHRFYPLGYASVGQSWVQNLES